MGECYDPFRGKEPYRPFSEKGYCIFEVLSAGTWYRIDMTCLRPEFYQDVPGEVLSLADKIEWEASMEQDDNGLIDPAPYYETSLREEFEDVLFIGSDIVYGITY